MLRPSSEPRPRHDPTVSGTVRVLRDEHELAEASARAAVHARLLSDRLAARAARDAWTAAYRGVDPTASEEPSEQRMPAQGESRGETLTTGAGEAHTPAA